MCAGEEQGQQDRQRGEGGENEQPLVGDLDPEDLHPVEGLESRVDRAAPGLPQPQLDPDGQQGDAGGGHQQRDPGRLEQGPHDEPLGGQPHGHGHGQGDEYGEEVGHPVDVGAPKGVDGDGPELALGEVEDAARLVDQDQPEGHEPVAGAGDDPDDQARLGTRPDRVVEAVTPGAAAGHDGGRGDQHRQQRYEKRVPIGCHRGERRSVGGDEGAHGLVPPGVAVGLQDVQDGGAEAELGGSNFTSGRRCC